MSYIGIIVSFVFVHNILLSQLLAGRSFLAATRDAKTACRFGLVITCLASASCFLTWAIYHGILEPLNFQYLQTLSFILIITGLGIVLDMAFAKLNSPARDYFPLAASNCAVLGVCLIAVKSGYTAAESLVAGASAGAGYFLTIALLAALREAMKKEWIPKPFQGIPITLISAGLMALAFMAFDEALLKNLFR